MSAHMLIAPDSDHDRMWVRNDHGVIKYIQATGQEWSPDPAVTGPAPVVLTATKRRYRHPAWRVMLAVYLDDRLRDIPPGYVMPGWVHGETLDASPCCKVCGRLADTPQERLCFRHMMEHLRELGI